MPAIEEPPAPVTSTMLDNSLRTRLDAAIKAKGDAATKPPVVEGEPTVPAKPVAVPAKAAEPAAPAKPTVPVAPAIPASDIYVPGSTHKADWERIKSEREALRSERDVSRAEAASLKAKIGELPPDTAKTLAALKKERDDYQVQLRSIAIERDPAFDREFSTATSTATALARSTVGSEHAATLDKVLSMPAGTARDKAIGELAESLPAYKQTMLGSALADLDRISFTKQAKIDEARQNWSRLQQEAIAEQSARESASKAKLESLISEWSDPEKGFPHLRTKAGDAEHNARVEGTLALARDIFSGNLDMEKMARASVWAASAEQLLGNINSLQGELKAANDRIAELTGISPGAGDQGTGGTVTGSDADPEPPVGTGYGSAVAAAVRRAGLPLR